MTGNRCNDSPEQFGSPNQDNSQCEECLVMPTFKI